LFLFCTRALRKLAFYMLTLSAQAICALMLRTLNLRLLERASFYATGADRTDVGGRCRFDRPELFTRRGHGADSLSPAHGLRE
jgi:hypothetical protein